MISADELKKHVASASIHGIIVDKFCYGKNLCPIILLEIDKGLKVSFNCPILPFGLSVCLGVESGRKSLLDA